MNTKQVALVALAAAAWSAREVRGAALCLLGTFDAQVQALLHNVMLSADDIAQISRSYVALEQTLLTRWPGSQVYLYGSLPSGLGTKISDLDVHLHIPGYNDSTDTYIMKETAKTLQSVVPYRYSQIEFMLDMLMFVDNTLKRKIDLTFIGIDSVDSTKLIGYYLSLDPRSLPLASILKYWFKVHKLTGRLVFPNYAVYIMTIFFLQQKQMAPSAYDLQKNLPPNNIYGWNYAFKEKPYRVKNYETLYELLGGFFKYFSEFNFKEYCVSPFVGRAVPRRELKHVRDEYTMYKTHPRPGSKIVIPKYSVMCIQDFFWHSNNAAMRVNNETATRFITYAKAAVNMFEQLTSDEFLRAILSTEHDDPTDQTVIDAALTKINKLSDCL